jgi:hypothetical protein
MNPPWFKLLDDAIDQFAEREMRWLPHDRHGRWLVLEAGAGRHLRGQPKSIRWIVDAASERRARRFSSLSRARAFARLVGGTVHRWRRTPPGGGKWQRISPWQRAVTTASATARLPTILGDAMVPA